MAQQQTNNAAPAANKAPVPLTKEVLASAMKRNTNVKVTEVDPFAKHPGFTPGKPGFEKGVTLAGRYVETKVVRSPKLLTSKKDSQGRKYRLLHTLRSEDGMLFDIWSVGQLDVTLPRLRPDQYVEIEYKGRDSKALREGESPAHLFSIRPEGGRLGPQINVAKCVEADSFAHAEVSDDEAEAGGEA